MNIHQWKRLRLRLGWYGVITACWMFACPMPVSGAAKGDSTRVNGTRLAIVLGTTAGAATAIQIYQDNAWWRIYHSGFHFQEDLEYARNLDKLGHLYGAAILTNVFAKSLEWADVSRGRSLVWGAVGSTLFQTYVEVRDGFSEWGFDRVDFAADLAGAWYPVLQHEVPFFRNFNFKFSYWPKSAGEPGAFPGQTHTVFDDYEGQTIWLSLTMRNLLPKSVSTWWPGYLCLSIGVGVRDNYSPNRYLVVFVAPDLDMTEIIPGDSALLRTIREFLNLVHLPLPAVRISPGAVWYGIYF